MELDMELRRIVAENMATRRKLKGWTQHDAAEAIGVPVDTYRSYEQCKAEPKYSV